MTRADVGADLRADDVRAADERRQVLVLQLRRDLERDVDELAERRIVQGLGLVVAERLRERLRVPAVDDRGVGQLRLVDVDHRRVRDRELVHAGERNAVDLLRELQRLRIGEREPDDLLEPGRAGGLHVDARVVLADELAHDRVDRELVRTRVDRELEVRGEPELLHSPRDDLEVLLELLLELLKVAHVVDALVEASRELRREGLQRHLLLRELREDVLDLLRRLRDVHLVHRNLGDEVLRALLLRDVAVDPARLLHGRKVALLKRTGLADVVRDVDREEVAGVDELVDIRKSKSGDVVEIFATDNSTSWDIPKFCMHLGHELLLQEEVLDDAGNKEFHYLVQKG